MIPALLLLCSSALHGPQTPGDYEISLLVDGCRREYRLHLPPQYDGQSPLPVVLAFHGMSANAGMLQRWSELDKTADKFGFVTVYPDGTGLGLLKGFKAGAATSRLEHRKPDDVRFIAAILDDLEQSLRIDRRRVYATGLSNGAMMCYRLAVEMPQRIAAIAPISGGLGTCVGLPTRPISVLHFHGTCDRVLPFDGRRGTLRDFQQTYYGASESVAIFGRAAGCAAAPQIVDEIDKIDDGTSVRVHGYADCQSGVEVMLVEIHGGGHQWPQHALPIRYLGTATMEIDANEMMWQFFQRHALRDE